MNIPIKNIMKVDTSKGVPVWSTCMHDIRSYATHYLHKENKKAPEEGLVSKNKLVDYQEQMNEIVMLIKNNFTNNAELGNNIILLSVSCINFLSLSIKKEHKCCASFIKHIFFNKFSGVAYTGAQTQKVVTLTRETLVPAILPFVLRDHDRIVSGYGVYAYSIGKNSDNASEIDSQDLKDKYAFMFERTPEDFSNVKEKLKDEESAKQFLSSIIMPAKGDTLYHNYDPLELLKDRGGEATLYSLCTLSRHNVEKYHNLKKVGIKLSLNPILTIETQNNTLVPFQDAARVLPFSVRRANAEGLVTTVYSADNHKRCKRGRDENGSLDGCETINKKQTTNMEQTPKNPEEVPVFEAHRKEILALYESIFKLFHSNSTKGPPETMANLKSDQTAVEDYIKNTTNIDKVTTFDKLYSSLSDLLGLYAIDKKEDDAKVIKGFKDVVDQLKDTRMANTVKTIIDSLTILQTEMSKINSSYTLLTTAKAPSKKKV